MAQTYTYSISTDFPNQKVAADSLTKEIEGSDISSATLDHIDVAVSAPDNCDIVFDAALSAPDVTILDGIVAAHQGDPLPQFVQLDAAAVTFKIVGFSGNTVPIFTIEQKNEAGEFAYMKNAFGEHVFRFRQSVTGQPNFSIYDASGVQKIQLRPDSDSFIISDAGFGVGTSAPNPNYGIDVTGNVNATAGYLVGGTVVVNSTRGLTNVKTADFGSEYANGSQSGPSYTLDWANGQKQAITLAGNITSLTITAPPGVGNFLLRILQDATGGRTITWPGSVKWAGGAAPTLSVGANAVDIVTFYYNGTNYFGVASLNFA